MNKNYKKLLLDSFRTIICLILISFVLTFAIESIHRGSINSGFVYLVNYFPRFSYNALIILVTLSFALLFKRRIFAYILISCLWIILTITNNVLMTFRGSPLTANDFSMIETGLSILDNYVTKSQIFMAIAGFIILLLTLGLLWWFLPKKKAKINYLISFTLIVLSFIAYKYGTIYAFNNKIISSTFWDLAYAYQDYGFTYCFTNTVINNGISKPDNYSKSTIDDILINLENESLAAFDSTSSRLIAKDKYPNILFIQLESFMDPTIINGIEFDTDPIPNFRNLVDNYSSGLLDVSTIGGGTANTEFEIMTGMNLDFFGAGEYPFNTILRTKTCESINYVLKELDYGTHALHNNSADFYYRNTVFANLGYDTFTSLEYIKNIERTPIGWAKDSILVSEIIDSLTSTSEPDFIYTISVQGHGGYPSDFELEDKHVSITSIKDGYNKSAIEYYTNQIYEMDQFVGQLIDAVNKLDEPTAIVFYGDHLPALGLNDNMLNLGSLYTTQYAIWDNIGIDKEDLDIETYQLTARVLDLLDINIGTLTRFHQDYLNSSSKDEETYLNQLKNLQYDLLYGKGYSYPNSIPYEPTDLKMGVNPIEITDYSIENRIITVHGNNLTIFSEIVVNDTILDSTLIDPNTLTADYTDNSSIKSLKLSQVNNSGIVLSSTDEFIK